MRREDLAAFVTAVLPDLPDDRPLYFVAETSQLWEAWIPDAPRLQVTFDAPAGVRRDAEAAVSAVAGRLGLPLLLESPGDIIPLPAGYAARARPAGGRLRHFDPVSAAFRAIAHGDEPDYHLVLRYLEHGWITWDEMTVLLDGVLPRFTMETIAQDAAEFRRKYRGLNQMWRARNGARP